MEKWKHKFLLKENKWVHIPSEEMIKYGSALHRYIRKNWRFPLYYYHLRNGGHVAAARLHKRNNYFCLIDIKGFFESTSQSRVTRELKKIIPYDKARLIAKLSTVRLPNAVGHKFAVPYGYPQSPVLATLCLQNSYAGNVIDSFHRSGCVTVSVYMDDIILSCKSLVTLNQHFDVLCKALRKSRYELNASKTQSPAAKISVFNLELGHQHLKVESERMMLFIQAFAKSGNEHERKSIAKYVNTVNASQARHHFPK
ncbi:reverse transcriptase domain-containing protein [Cronobacter universalis]|uniref:Retron-type reverse transcriptase n=2 Tax=Cronobacter universalis NCTC 9529 TaxID=1074000 RepID=A0ABY1W5M2_9ENTR|nr:reverse transcriptase domain-containing protein [Cronobacter universalis]STD14885.1 Retron-type reverse transcriptase [Cronobacter universalis NCTC 9529]